MGNTTIKEHSAGAVLFHRSNGRVEYLALRYPAGHWDFPKGNVEEHEAEDETVKREVREETGIKGIRLIHGFRKGIEYYYRKGGRLIRKRVVFYLAEAPTKEVALSYEHLGYAWLPYEDAHKRLTYGNAKEVLKNAHSFLTATLGPW